MSIHTLLLALAMVVPGFGEPYMGVGGLGLPPLEKIEQFSDTLQAAGLNHIQCGIPSGAADVRRRVAALQRRGISVYGTSTAFIQVRGEREDYQIRADGSVKKGTVCPRSERRSQEMIQTTKAIADTGADGMFWDFITVESRTKEACFCPACVAAFNKAASTDYTREQLIQALETDPQVLQTWVAVRGESTTEAMRKVVQAAHGYRPQFRVGGYVIAPGNDLGMDTEGMSHALDILGPMVYQGRGPAPLGWMRQWLAKFTALTGPAQIIECIDTGFWVDEPVDELINTTWDCHRAGIAGWALWPFSAVSAEDLAGVAAVPALAHAFHAPLAAGDQAAAMAGLRRVLKQAGDVVAAHGTEKEAFEAASLRQAARKAIEAGDAINTDDTLATPIARLLFLRAKAVERKLHASDRIFRAGDYEVAFCEQTQSVEVRAPGWTACQNDRALNIDSLTFEGLVGDASTDPYNLGLLRTRVTEWFDPWGAQAQTSVQQVDPDTVRIAVHCEANGCILGRIWTLQARQPWMTVDIFTINSDTRPHQGKLWIWNGMGIPGFLEANGNAPWEDDRTELLEQTILVASDEGRFIAIGRDPKDGPLPEPDRGMSHLWYELDLAPGEMRQVRLYLAFGQGYPEAVDEILRHYPGPAGGWARPMDASP